MIYLHKFRCRLSVLIIFISFISWLSSEQASATSSQKKKTSSGRQKKKEIENQDAEFAVFGNICVSVAFAFICVSVAGFLAVQAHLLNYNEKITL